MVSAALISAPFIMDVSNVAYADPAPKPDTYFIDEIGNLIVPLHGTIPVRNLKAIYGAYINDFEVTSVNSYGSGDLFAYNEPGYSAEGLLKIHPYREGTATFTVSWNNNTSQDTFDVTVVNDPSITNERNFDISDAATKAIHSSSPNEVEGLLSGIGPANSTGNVEGNNPPTLNPQNQYNPFQNGSLELGSFFYLSTQELSSFFRDIDGDDISVIVFDNIDNSETTPAARFVYKSEFNSWIVESVQVGESTFTAVALDSRGGVVASQPFTIEVLDNQVPTMKNNPVANHLATEGNELNLSSNSELDLNEIFYDAPFQNLQYSAEVSFKNGYGCGSQTINNYPITFTQPTNILSYESVRSRLNAAYPNLNGDIHVTNLKAKDNLNQFSPSLSSTINLHYSEYEGFNENIPQNMELYASNSAGESSFTVNTDIQDWFDDDLYLFDIQQPQSEINHAVIPSMYEENEREYIKFTAGSLANTQSRLKLYSALNEEVNKTVWFQNDIVVKVMKPTLSGMSQSINLYSLLGDYNYNWEYFTNNFNEFVSMTNVTGVTYGFYDSGVYTLTLDNVNSNGTVLTIIPDSSEERGSRIFKIPFVRLENVPL